MITTCLILVAIKINILVLVTYHHDVEYVKRTNKKVMSKCKELVYTYRNLLAYVQNCTLLYGKHQSKKIAKVTCIIKTTRILYSNWQQQLQFHHFQPLTPSLTFTRLRPRPTWIHHKWKPSTSPATTRFSSVFAFAQDWMDNLIQHLPHCTHTSALFTSHTSPLHHLTETCTCHVPKATGCKERKLYDTQSTT